MLAALARGAVRLCGCGPCCGCEEDEEDEQVRTPDLSRKLLETAAHGAADGEKPRPGLAEPKGGTGAGAGGATGAEARPAARGMNVLRSAGYRPPAAPSHAPAGAGAAAAAAAASAAARDPRMDSRGSSTDSTRTPHGGATPGSAPRSARRSCKCADVSM